MYLPSSPCSCHTTNPRTLSKCFQYCTSSRYFTRQPPFYPHGIPGQTLLFRFYSPSNRRQSPFHALSWSRLWYQIQTWHVSSPTFCPTQSHVYHPCFVMCSLLLTATLASHSHRTLLAFHAATMHDYISTAPSLDDGILAFILPSLLTPLQSSQKDTNVAVSCLAAFAFHLTHSSTSSEVLFFYALSRKE